MCESPGERSYVTLTPLQVAMPHRHEAVSWELASLHSQAAERFPCKSPLPWETVNGCFVSPPQPVAAFLGPSTAHSLCSHPGSFPTPWHMASSFLRDKAPPAAPARLPTPYTNCPRIDPDSWMVDRWGSGAGWDKRSPSEFPECPALLHIPGTAGLRPGTGRGLLGHCLTPTRKMLSVLLPT